jgi:uncharacterized protein YuzE
MKKPYLEVTYRKGQPLAAYFYLDRSAGQTSARTRQIHDGLVVDFADNGKPIGIEITAPEQLTLASLNRLLKQLGFPPVRRADLVHFERPKGGRVPIGIVPDRQ